VVFLVIFFLFFVLPFIRAMRGGGRRYGSSPGVMIFPGGGWGSGGGGSSWGGSDWGGGGGGASPAAAAASVAAALRGLVGWRLAPDRQRPARIAQAVTAELRSAGEIVTIVTARSDPYRDVALAWAAAVAFLALAALEFAPHFYLALIDRAGPVGDRMEPRAVLGWR
jgi:hypothetical protein